MKRHLIAIVLASLSLLMNSCATREPPISSDPPTTAPAAAVDHGREISRTVDQTDEIISILENGMTVIARRVPSPAVSVRGYVWAGGVYEGKWLGGGLSHLLEHLVAGGTNARRTEQQNRDLLQEIGNNSNAYTTQEHTAFFVNTTPDNLDKGVDLITGWMLGAKITPAEYAREYEVVQRELEMDKGEPTWAYYITANGNRYHVSPARVPTIGYQPVIQGLSRDDVYSYYKSAYQPNNMVFCITGNLDPEVMLRSMQRYVADAPPGRVFSHNIEPEPPITAPRTVVATFPKLGQSRLQLAFPTVTLQDGDMYALDVLSVILGHGDSSIFVEEIRDKQQLVSSIAASDDTPFFVEGTFAIDLELDTARIGAATSAVLDILDRIKREGVSDDRLARAKTQLKTQRLQHPDGRGHRRIPRDRLHRHGGCPLQ